MWRFMGRGTRHVEVINMKSFFFGLFITILIIVSLASGLGCLVLFVKAMMGRELELWLKLCPLIAAVCGGSWFWFIARD